MKWFIFITLLALNSNAIAADVTHSSTSFLSGVKCEHAKEGLAKIIASTYGLPAAAAKNPQEAR